MKKKIFVFSLLLAASIALAGFFDDLPFYLVNKGGTTTINFRYPIDGATLTNPSITPPAISSAVVATLDLAAQGAELSNTTVYTIPANAQGKYRVSCAMVITQAATTSSTLPICQFAFTTADTNTVKGGQSLTSNSSTNTVGTITNFPSAGASTGFIVAKANTNIQVSTFGFATSGVTPMQYALHFTVEYLGA